MSPSVVERIRRFMEGKKIGLFEPGYGMPIQFTLKVGQEFILAVNAEAFESLRNTIMICHGGFREKVQECRFMRVKIDHTVDEDAFIRVADVSDTLILKNLTISDSQMCDETGILQIYLTYRPPGVNRAFFAFKYYNLVDDTIDDAYAFNDQPPLKTINVQVGYFGGLRSDAEIANLLNDFAERFLFATKNFASLDVNYIGRHNLPEDNAVVGGVNHNYTEWWNSVPHDLVGTDLLPLDISNQEDFEFIKLAWYEEHGLQQLLGDIRESFDMSQSGRYVIFVEAPYWVATAGNFAVAPYYNAGRFKQEVEGVSQYGIHPEFGPLTPDQELAQALHELGHLFGLLHPPINYEPTAANWEVFYYIICFEIFANLMHQGLLRDYPTDRFYSDADISRILGSSGVGVDIPLIGIPIVEPVGDPTCKDNLTVSGKKEAGSGIALNGQLVISPDNNTTWSVEVPLSLGINRMDVAESRNGRVGHPRIIYVERIGEQPPTIPETTISVSHLSQPSGLFLRVTISSRAEAGLKSIWWWAYKVVGGDTYQFLPGKGRWQDVYGAVEKDLEYKIAFDEPGTYVLKARSRDVLYPVSGEQHQSNIATIHIEITP